MWFILGFYGFLLLVWISAGMLTVGVIVGFIYRLRGLTNRQLDSDILRPWLFGFFGYLIVFWIGYSTGDGFLIVEPEYFLFLVPVAISLFVLIYHRVRYKDDRSLYNHHVSLGLVLFVTLVVQAIRVGMIFQWFDPDDEQTAWMVIEPAIAGAYMSVEAVLGRKRAQ